MKGKDIRSQKLLQEVLTVHGSQKAAGGELIGNFRKTCSLGKLWFSPTTRTLHTSHVHRRFHSCLLCGSRSRLSSVASGREPSTPGVRSGELATGGLAVGG